MKHKYHKPSICYLGIDAIEEMRSSFDQVTLAQELVVKAQDMALKEIEAKFTAAVDDALHQAFEDEKTYITFPLARNEETGSGMKVIEGAGFEEVADPLTVHLKVGLLSESGDHPIYAFNIREALKHEIEACASIGYYSDGLGRLSIALRLLADEIDVAIEKGSP